MLSWQGSTPVGAGKRVRERNEMTGPIPRSVWEPGGFAYTLLGGKCKPLPPDVAYVETDFRGQRHFITWTEVIERRRKWQAERLARIMTSSEPEVVPCYVWTFFNRQDIPYHGWYCYVVSRYFDIGVNFRGFRSELAESIMTAIPLGMLPMAECFEGWMKAFAERHPRAKHKHDPRKAGSLCGWIHNRSQFTLNHPTSPL
jgi:hypothetical protein